MPSACQLSSDVLIWLKSSSHCLSSDSSTSSLQMSAADISLLLSTFGSASLPVSREEKWGEETF